MPPPWFFIYSRLRLGGIELKLLKKLQNHERKNSFRTLINLEHHFRYYFNWNWNSSWLSQKWCRDSEDDPSANPETPVKLRACPDSGHRRKTYRIKSGHHYFVTISKSAQVYLQSTQNKYQVPNQRPDADSALISNSGRTPDMSGLRTSARWF